MSNELTIRENAGIEYCGIMVTTMADMIALAETLSKSDFVPSVYRGKPGNIIAAIQFGREIGLSPMQALQGVAVVNGKPAVYGTTYLAVCHNAPGFRDVVQSVEKDASGKLVATCTAKRTGRADVTRVFTQDMAITAGLWGKNVHAQYPETMLLWRATHLACDTMFADVLKGIPIRENAEADYEEAKPEPVGSTASERLRNALIEKHGVIEYSVEDVTEQAATSPVEAANGSDAANDTQKPATQAAAARGAALWARWQATEGLPQRATTGTGRNELVNAALVAILGDKLATVRIFQHGTPEQLDAVENYLNSTDEAAKDVAEVDTEEADEMDPAHWDGVDEAPLLEMSAPDAESKATIGAMSR